MRNDFKTFNEEIVIPTVHLNGTSKQDLLLPLMAAQCAVDAARVALMACAPHGRDYYVRAPDNTKLASSQHCDRLKALETVQRQLEYLIVKVNRQ